jgi:hypothetical protein
VSSRELRGGAAFARARLFSDLGLPTPEKKSYLFWKAMVDTMLKHRDRAQQLGVPPRGGLTR